MVDDTQGCDGEKRIPQCGSDAGAERVDKWYSRTGVLPALQKFSRRII